MTEIGIPIFILQCRPYMLKTIIKILLLVTLVQTLEFCTSADEQKTQRELSPEQPNKPLTRAEMETIKACNLKLDRCLKSCDSEYPDFSPRDQRRGTCRDSCVNNLKGSDGCIIHYQTVRPNRYRSNIAPYR